MRHFFFIILGFFFFFFWLEVDFCRGLPVPEAMGHVLGYSCIPEPHTSTLLYLFITCFCTGVVCSFSSLKNATKARGKAKRANSLNVHIFSPSFLPALSSLARPYIFFPPTVPTKIQLGQTSECTMVPQKGVLP